MNEERESCLHRLRSLLPRQFECVLKDLANQGLLSADLPGPSASQSERAVALLRWAESPSGCGLTSVLRAIDDTADYVTEDFLREEFREVAGQVELVRPLASWEHADPMTFYRIVPVTWRYIAAEIDAKRSLYREVWPEITDQRSTCGIWCIRGEPLSGKSTFARRLAYDLATQRQVVIRVKEGQNHPEIWNRLAYFCSSIDRPVYVLADDDFGDRSCRNALRECLEEALNEGLPLKVIVTCTSDAFTDVLSPLPVSRKELTLSVEDKHELLSKIGLDQDAVDSRTLEELMALQRFYAFLAEAVELEEGRSLRPLQTVESDRLNHVQRVYPRVYLALKYISFIHQFGLTVPSSLIDRLENGTLSDILALEGANNYIFVTPDAEITMLQAGHPSLTKAYWQVYTRTTSPLEILHTLITAARKNNSHECVFIMHLLRECVYSSDIGLSQIANFIVDLGDFLRALQELIGVEHLLAWRAVYQKLGQTAEADRCLADAVTRRPLNVPDCIVKANLIRVTVHRANSSKFAG